MVAEETKVWTCRVCNKPVTGEAAFDPDSPGTSASYLHPLCAKKAKEELAAAKDRLARAAPDLYNACQFASTALYHVAHGMAVSRLPELLERLEAALRKAEGK